MAITALLVGFLCALMFSKVAWAWALATVVAFDVIIAWFTGQLSLDVLFDSGLPRVAVRETGDQLSQALIDMILAIVGVGIGKSAKRLKRSRAGTAPLTDEPVVFTPYRRAWPYWLVAALVALVLVAIAIR